MDPSLKMPFVMQVCGPTQSGKSTFVSRLIINSSELLEKPIHEVFWFSPHGNLPKELLQSDPKTTPIINLYTELPASWETNRRTSTKASSSKQADASPEDEDEGSDDEGACASTEFSTANLDNRPRLIVIDDFGDESRNSNAITALYTRGAHHQQISVVQMLQNIFMRGPHASTRARNVQYMALMRQTRDYQQIKTLAGQLTQSVAGKNAFLRAYDDATDSTQYGYLFLSFHPRDDPALKLRTNIFPGEGKYGRIYTLPGSKKYLNKRADEEEEEADYETT